MLMEYQNRRGGRVVLQDVQKPERDEWDGPLEAFQAALALEKLANRAMLELHKSGEQTEDKQVRGSSIWERKLDRGRRLGVLRALRKEPTQRHMENQRSLP